MLAGSGALGGQDERRTSKCGEEHKGQSIRGKESISDWKGVSMHVCEFNA